jgi:hypothetical protein
MAMPALVECWSISDYINAIDAVCERAAICSDDWQAQIDVLGIAEV